MTGYTLDTNSIIYYAHSDKQVVKTLDVIFSEHVPFYISTVSEIELFGFPSLSEKEAGDIERFLLAVAIIPLDSHIARIAALLRKQYGIKTIDSAIAATSIFTKTTLITRNVKDFNKIPNLFLQAI